MKRIETILYGMLGAVLVAVVAPLMIHAAQTYVLTDNSIGQKTAFNTHIPNAFEAVRSMFSGAAAPTTPTPVEGQPWYETDTDLLHIYYNGTSWYDVALAQLANVFTANQTISGASSPQWSATDTTNTITARVSANDTEGRVGTNTNHPFCIETNGNCRLTWNGAGSMTAGVVPLARMKVDEQSGNHSAAYTTTPANKITLSSMTVSAGDRVSVWWNARVDAATSQTRMTTKLLQSAGTATSQWGYSGGPAGGTGVEVWIGRPSAVDTYQESGSTYLYITGSGTLTLALSGSTVGANATASYGHMAALVLRGT